MSNRTATITKMGELFKTSGHQQYPTPQIRGPVLRIYYTDRQNNMSVPCFVEYTWPNLQLITLRQAVLPWGAENEFDANGISIQCAQGHNIWYTGYRKGHVYPYVTSIGSARVDSTGNLFKTGKAKGLTQSDPISVCTPFVYENFGPSLQTVFFYNTHSRWDTGVSPPEAMYLVKGVVVKHPFDLRTIDPVYTAGFKESSITRPWLFKFQDEEFMFLSIRDNYGHRENSVCAYSPMLYSFKTQQYLELKFKNCEEDFMKAYMSAVVVDNKCFVFYNNAYASGIQMGELSFA